MKIVAANWKMNLDVPGVKAYLKACHGAAKDWEAVRQAGVTPMIFAPAPFLGLCLKDLPEGFEVGAQNVHHVASGAYTGEVSAAMVRSIGAGATLVGHSERRQYQRETGEELQQKIARALENNLRVMLCVGETLPQREAGQAAAVVAQQLREALAGFTASELGPENFAVAYEPVWAIGTGKEASAADAEDMSVVVLDELKALGLGAAAVLYGGSVKPANAGGFGAQPHVGGALVGGAALDPAGFLAIAQGFAGA